MNERQFELAQRLEQAQREAGIRAARASKVGTGSESCLTCGKIIPLERRRFVPNATRCTSCQARFDELKTGYRR